MEDKSTPEAADTTTGDQGDHSQQATDQTADDKGTEGAPVTTTSDDKTTTSADDKTDGQGDGKKTDAPAKSEDDDLDSWAEKRGYGKLETDKERKIAQDARNNQREFHNKAEAKKTAAAVDKTIAEADPHAQDDDTLDPLEKEVAGVKSQLKTERELRQRSEYFSENNVTTEEAQAMQDILKEKVDRATTPAAKEKAFDFLTDPENLADWHEMAQARLAKTSDGAAAEAARTEERERLAKLSQTNGPDRSASSTTPKGRETDDERRNKLWST